MRRLSSVAASPVQAGEPLPTVFTPFDQHKIKPRKGATTVVAAQPGAGKSLVVAYWVARMGLPTLYFSADTDETTAMERAAAMVTGDTQDTVRAAVRRGDGGPYVQALSSLSNLRWVFESDPTYRDLELETAAFAEAYGGFPEVIVVDNLMNVVAENDNEWGGMRDHTRAMKRLCRITGAAVFVLHHMSEERNESEPLARAKVQGKVNQIPEMILSLALDGPQLKVACVKNRWGPADPSGQTYVSIFVDLERVQFYASRQAMQMGQPA